MSTGLEKLDLFCQGYGFEGAFRSFVSFYEEFSPKPFSRFLTLLVVWFTIFFMSIKSDVKKSVRQMMWGGVSAIGTLMGKARNVGKSTVNVGIARIRLELWGWRIACVSLAFTITIAAVMKSNHSKVMFVELVMLIPNPKGCEVRGHRSCTCPPTM